MSWKYYQTFFSGIRKSFSKYSDLTQVCTSTSSQRIEPNLTATCPNSTFVTTSSNRIFNYQYALGMASWWRLWGQAWAFLGLSLSLQSDFILLNRPQHSIAIWWQEQRGRWAEDAQLIYSRLMMKLLSCFILKLPEIEAHPRHIKVMEWRWKSAACVPLVSCCKLERARASKIYNRWRPILPCRAMNI